MDKYIYGLDLSMSDTGVTIFNNITPVFIGSIPTKKNQTHGERLKVIYDFMLELKNKYPPYVVCIERCFSRYNTSTAVLYRVHGLINFLFYDIKQIYYPPKTIKESLIKGNATKKQIQDKIKASFNNISFNNDDESDSFAIVLTYLAKEEGVQLIEHATKK